MATPHVWLDFTVSMSPLVPFTSTICPSNGPKRRQKAPKSAQCAPTPRNQARAVFWATWLKTEIPRAPSPPATPHCPWFPTLGIAQQATWTPVPVVTSWSCRATRPAHGGGPTVGPPQSPGRKKSFFPKLFLDHLGCSNKCF